MQHTLLLDLGMGNLYSVARSIAAVSDTKVTISRKPDAIKKADRLIIPGQGAFKQASTCVNEPDLNEALTWARMHLPVLGICIGMQIMLENSDEAPECKGLGWIKGVNQRFIAFDQSLKIPHVGWNKIHITYDHPIFKELEENRYFYFVHSYYVAEKHPYCIAESEHGVRFSCAFAHENLAGAVFHPEKSSTSGLKMLHSFLNWNP